MNLNLDLTDVNKQKEPLSFTPSPFQQAIFDFIEHGEGSAIVDAVAGSGKTTTIVQSLNLIPLHKRTLFLAFNKAIADELRRRVPDHITVKTLNGLGHGAWCKYARGNIKLDTDKTRKFLFSDKYKAKFGSDRIRENAGNIFKLVGFGKSNCIVPTYFVGGLYEGFDESLCNLFSLNKDTEDNWENLIDHFGLDFEKGESAKWFSVNVARHILNDTLNQKNVIDFDDQLYMTVAYQAPMQQYDFVFVDEAQDISEIQRVMIKMALDGNGRLIAVGDPHQAIYGFRGAASDSMKNIAKEFGTTHLPLSISYRCPKAIVSQAQKFVAHIQASDEAPSGEVIYKGQYFPTLFQPKDMVVCRCTAPLVSLAYNLIENEIPVIILGRDIGKNLIALIESLEPHNVDNLKILLANWRNKEIQKLKHKQTDPDLSKIDDKFGAIMNFTNCIPTKSIRELVNGIEKLFSNTPCQSVTLSSIHRAKGLEAQRVFILDAFLMPIKYATKEWQIQQEDNLHYVAITRAMSELIYIESPLDD